jgi:hypothetical protein
MTVADVETNSAAGDVPPIHDPGAVGDVADVSDALERINLGLRKLAGTQLKKEDQPALARLVDLRDCVVLERLYGLLPSLEVAIAALMANPANSEAVKGILDNVEKRTKALPLTRMLRRNSASANVSIGLAVLGVAGLVVLLIVAPLIPSNGMIVGLNGPMLILVSVAGAFGSIVSIARRIAEFGRSPADSPLLRFFTGLFKPVVGVGFALLVFAALKSGFITLQPPVDAEAYFFAAIGFVAGFSEKLAPDLVAKAEQQVEGSAGRSTKDITVGKLQPGRTNGAVAKSSVPGS